MMLSRYITVLSALALSAQHTTAQSWYPANFANPGGEEICLNDGAHPAWIENQGLLMQSLDACCSKYFSFMRPGVCAANSNGVAYTGSGLYYPKYQESKCAQDCETGGACGGLVLDASTPLFNSIPDCCSQVMGHIDPDICAELSIPSGGTNKYFPDAQRSICIKDCEPGTSVGCARVSNPSAKLYSDLSTCCSEGLPWASSDFCNTRSIEQTTGKWFVSNNICRQDCASGATCANLTDSTQILYDSALDCCKSSLAFLPEDRCETLSLGNPLTGTSKWFASYESGNERCYQDCPTGTGNCGGIADPNVQLFDNSTSCCQTKLSHKSLSYCESVSGGGVYAGTQDYYPDFSGSKCVQDCDSSTAGCGGIIKDSSKKLFATAAECCSASMPNIDESFCEDRSNLAGTGTGKFYVEPGAPVCVQDSGSLRLSDPTSPLYADINQCCTEAIPWVSTDFCVSRSSGGYSNKWFVDDYSTQTCVQDCATGGANCVSATKPSTDFYDTAEECCNGKLNWVDVVQCSADSRGIQIAPTYTNKFYVSYPDNKCMQDCADTDPAPCGGIPSDELTLFDDAEACCSEKLSWLSLEVCVANTNGVAPVGTNAWYVDWTLLKCVQDCDGTAPCGGLKGAFDTVYGDSTKCCARISWVDPTECVLA